jgi:hypothetical protein
VASVVSSAVGSMLLMHKKCKPTCRSCSLLIRTYSKLYLVAM